MEFLKCALAFSLYFCGCYEQLGCGFDIFFSNYLRSKTEVSKATAISNDELILLYWAVILSEQFAFLILFLSRKLKDVSLSFLMNAKYDFSFLMNSRYDLFNSTKERHVWRSDSGCIF